MFDFAIGTYTNSAKLRKFANKIKKKNNAPTRCYVVINSDTFDYGVAPVLFDIGESTKSAVVFLHSVVDLAREGLIDISNATLSDYYVSFFNKEPGSDKIKIEYDMINVLRYRVNNADDDCYTRNMKIAQALKGDCLL